MILLIDRENLCGLFLHFKDAFTLKGSLFCGVINLDRVQFFELLTFDEAALVAEPLVGEVLAATIAYFLVGVPVLLLRPIANNFTFPHVIGLLIFHAISKMPAGIHYLLPTTRV